MDLIASVNAKIVAAIDRRSGQERLATVAIEADELLLRFAGGTSRTIDWKSLRRAVGFRRDVYAGDETGLLLEFEGAGMVEILASVPGWIDVAVALEALGEARRFGEWHAEAINAPIGEAVDIWSTT